ncbi:putative threonine--tRNA ligase [Helianthus anomalus]
MLCTQILWRFSLHCRRISPPFNAVLRRLYASPPSLQPQMGKAANNAPKSTLSIAKDDAYLQSVIPKRIQMFESIKTEQIAHLKSISGDPIKITLPDGTVKEGKKWETTPFDIAKEIGKGLASNALISQVDGVLWDMSRPLEADCQLKIFTFESDEGRDTFWHSSAHILGQALEQTYGCKLCIGPCTTRGEGFYYDGFYGELGLNDDHFDRIVSEAKKAVTEKQPFERIEVSRQQALEMFSDNKFKASAAYWRGNKDRESLQRVYGISYPDQKRLKEYIALLEEAKKYDHRELGKKQELFFFHPLRITLPDGTVKEGKKWETTPFDIAKEIGKGLASNALISQVDGVLWDMSRPLEADCQLKIFTFESDEGRDTFWHSSAHILGQALEQTYGCKLCIGPCTTRGEGFYYDGFYGELGLNDDHFDRIVSEAKKAVTEKQPFERIEVSRQQALEMFSDNKFKVEIISDLPEDKTITVYRCGPLVDLCRGPHIPNTQFVKAIACLKASAAYWRGNKDRESLQRVYGISYPDQKRLKEYIALLEEAKKYDHRELGKKQELFFFHPLSPGSCFFLPHGTRITEKLMTFIRNEYRKRGYLEVTTPNMYNMQLWETSGHAANYKENMFVFDIEKQEFGLKPMNCPGHCLIFDNRVRSYRELPLRIADFGVLHRNEASGALTGLTRVRRFQQDDAHIFCRESQIKEEVKSVLEFINYAYDVFGFTFELKLSTRPEKYLGDLETWDKAEKALEDALNEFGKPWQINEADGAFYGPKIDISVSDAMKRKFQCATLQLDFQLPQRFNLTYSAEDETKRERPVMIHRAILGSVERMFAILLEHYKGKWPFWLSPRQAIVCPVSDKSQDYGQQVKSQIEEAGYYVDIDSSDRTIQKKVREAQLAQYNYILVVGEEEANNGKVSVRVRDRQEHSVKTIPDLLNHFKEEVDAFH